MTGADFGVDETSDHAPSSKARYLVYRGPTQQGLTVLHYISNCL